VRCLPLFRPFDPDDLRFVQRMLTVRRSCAPDVDILRTDERGSGPFTLWDGWAYLYREVPEIGAAPRRQILEILLPGDMFGLGMALTGRVGNAVRALTPSTICVHDPRIFAEIFTEQPDLVRGLMEALARDAERSAARLAIIGQGLAIQRAAFLVLEIWDRLAQRDLAPVAADGKGGVRIPFPLQRRHLAAALGMSGTHVRRSLAELETLKLLRAETDAMVLLDPAGLAALCGFSAVPDERGRRAVL
jgi:CRP/FNR family transcriptional regulator, anaerobic regulatory protein